MDNNSGNSDQNLSEQIPVVSSTISSDIAGFNNTEVSSPMPQIGSKKPYLHAKILIPTLAGVMLLAFGFAVVLSFTSQNNKHSQSIQSAGNSTKNYRIYQQISGENDSKNTITISDKSDNIIATHSTKFPLHLIAEVQNKYFILKEDDLSVTISSPLGPSDKNYEGYGGHYWLLDNSGKLVQLKIDSTLRKDSGGSNAISELYPVSSQEILYYQCDSIYEPDCGKLHRVNFINGSSKEYQTGTGHLIGVSNNGNIAYLLSLSLPNELIDYDLIHQKIIKRSTIPNMPKGARQLWISPNGTYLAYADEETNVITVYDTTSDKKTNISMPKDWMLTGWSGEVTIPIPQWSPDEQNIAFVALGKTEQYVVNVDVQRATYSLVYTLNSSGDDTEFSIGWADSKNLTYSAIKSSRSFQIGFALGNYRYNLDDKSYSTLSINNGALLNTNFTRSPIK